MSMITGKVQMDDNDLSTKHVVGKPIDTTGCIKVDCKLSKKSLNKDIEKESISNVKWLILCALIWNIFVLSVFVYIVAWKGMSGWLLFIPIALVKTVKEVD